MIDVSGSAEARSQSQAERQLVDLVAGLVQPGSCLRWVAVVPWASAVESMIDDPQPITVPPLTSAACPPLQLKGEEEWVRQLREQKEREHASACQRLLENAQKGAAQSRQVVADQLRRKLAALPRQPRDQSCVHQAILQARESPTDQLTVVLTDGDHRQCGPPPAATTSPAHRAAVWVVLVPEQRDGDGVQDQIARRRQTLLAAHRGIEVITFSQLKMWLDSLGWPPKTQRP
ncbi:MAG TPA: hypothetical protein VF017_23590 [Thermoanaerobaculia bacterium]|nr:hypothetical protein [Thermoanaerobaculia bacterium]